MLNFYEKGNIKNVNVYCTGQSINRRKIARIINVPNNNQKYYLNFIVRVLSTLIVDRHFYFVRISKNWLKR